CTKYQAMERRQNGSCWNPNQDLDWAHSIGRSTEAFSFFRRPRPGWRVRPAPGDLWVLPLGGDRKPYPYLTTPFDESEASLSPNGRWLAYTSNESGKYEVFVRPFPDAAGGKWQISASGGAHTPPMETRRARAVLLRSGRPDCGRKRE